MKKTRLAAIDIGTNSIRCIVVEADQQGRFTIGHVPPGELELMARVPLEQPKGAWTEQSQRQFAVQPGEKLHLGNVEHRGAGLP